MPLSNGTSTANDEMIAGYEEPGTLRLARTILIASPPLAGRTPFSPAPIRNAAATSRSRKPESG